MADESTVDVSGLTVPFPLGPILGPDGAGPAAPGYPIRARLHLNKTPYNGDGPPPPPSPGVHCDADRGRGWLNWALHWDAPTSWSPIQYGLQVAVFMSPSGLPWIAYNHVLTLPPQKWIYGSDLFWVLDEYCVRILPTDFIVTMSVDNPPSIRFWLRA